MTRQLSPEPQDIDDDAWYYEEPKGIYVVHKIGPAEHVHLSIPWKMLARSVDRWRREKQRLAKKRATKR